MKNILIIFLLILSFKTLSFECPHNEAQFIGKVKNVTKQKIEINKFLCTFQISFEQFVPSMICPLDEGMALNYQYTDVTRSLQNGDRISSYLVQNANSEEIILE